MPTPEQQQPPTRPVEGTPTPEEQQQPEQQFKTLTVRVEESLHTHLRFIAQLNGTSIAEEIRAALQTRITDAQDDPEVIARARQVREQIESEAAARTAVIAGFLGKPAVAAVVKPPAATTRKGRRSNTPAGNE